MFLVVSRSNVNFAFKHPFFACHIRRAILLLKIREPRQKFVHHCLRTLRALRVLRASCAFRVLPPLLVLRVLHVIHGSVFYVYYVLYAFFTLNKNTFKFLLRSVKNNQNEEALLGKFKTYFLLKNNYFFCLLCIVEIRLFWT